METIIKPATALDINPAIPYICIYELENQISYRFGT